jgi:hypothetical protein
MLFLREPLTEIPIEMPILLWASWLFAAVSTSRLCNSTIQHVDCFACAASGRVTAGLPMAGYRIRED